MVFLVFTEKLNDRLNSQQTIRLNKLEDGTSPQNKKNIHHKNDYC